MQYLRGNRAQQKAPDGSEAMSRHHDQIGSILPRLIDDSFCGIALTEYPAGVEVIQRSTEEIIQCFLRFLPPLYILERQRRERGHQRWKRHGGV